MVRLFVFTGTGNSLMLARWVKTALGDEATIEWIPRTMEMNDPVDATAVVLFFPVYMFGPPRLVVDWLTRLRVTERTRVYAVTNFAGASGGTGVVIRKTCKQAGLTLSGFWGCKMPSNYMPFGGAIAEAKQRLLFDAARTRMQAVAACVSRAEDGPMETGVSPFNRISAFFYRLLARRIPRLDRHFKLNEDCVQCGLCSTVCPVDNIRMVEGTPTWQGHCEQCFACVNWCPQSAIEYGRTTKGRKRYHQPEVTVGDMKAEAGKD